MIEHVPTDGGQAGQPAPLGEHGTIFKADRHDGGLLVQIGKQVSGGLGPGFPLGGLKGGEQGIPQGILPAAIVQAAGGGQQGGQVKVAGEGHLTQIQVKVPGGQGADIAVIGQAG